MKWRDQCPCETRQVSVWTWVGLAFVVAASLLAEPIIESLPW